LRQSYARHCLQRDAVMVRARVDAIMDAPRPAMSTSAIPTAAGQQAFAKDIDALARSVQACQEMVDRLLTDGQDLATEMPDLAGDIDAALATVTGPWETVTSMLARQQGHLPVLERRLAANTVLDELEACLSAHVVALLSHNLPASVDEVAAARTGCEALKKKLALSLAANESRLAVVEEAVDTAAAAEGVDELDHRIAALRSSCKKVQALSEDFAQFLASAAALIQYTADIDEVMALLDSHACHSAGHGIGVDAHLRVATSSTLATEELQQMLRAQEIQDSVFTAESEQRLLEKLMQPPPVTPADLERFSISAALQLLTNVEEADAAAFALKFKLFADMLGSPAAAVGW